MKNMLICIAFLLVVPVFCGAFTAYDIGSFHPTDLNQYLLAPSLSSENEYNSFQSKHHDDRFLNGLTLTGSLHVEKPYLSLIARANIAGSFCAKNTYFAYTEKIRETDFTGDWSSTFRHYKGIQFWGADYSGNMFTVRNTDHEFSPLYSDSDYMVHKDYLKNQVSLVTGLGRQYECQDAYKAWYCLRVLDKRGCLQRQVSVEDIDALTYVLYHIRSINRVDSREEYIQQSEALITHFQTMDYIKPGMEAKASATLMELWQRGDDTIRLTGSKVELAAMGSVLNCRLKSTYDIYSKSRNDDPAIRYYEADTGINLIFSYEHPIINVLQLSSQFRMMHGWADVYVNDEIFPVDNQWKAFTQAEGKTEISYYPDCRTVYSAALYGRVLDNIYQDYPLDPGSTFISPSQFRDLRIYDASLTLGAKYNFSPRLAINGTLAGIYSYEKEYNFDFHQRRIIRLDLNMSYRIY